MRGGERRNDPTHPPAGSWSAALSPSESFPSLQPTGEGSAPDVDRPISDYVAIIPYLVAALGMPVAAIAVSIEASLPELIDSFFDDAYYYFEVAQNIARGQGSTFDGISLTNGYHPLWMLLLVPIFKLGLDHAGALIMVRLLQSAIWSASVGIVFIMASRLGARVAFSPALVVLVYLSDFWFAGMESGLALLLLAAALISTRRWASPLPPGSGRWATGSLLAMAVLARLDLVFAVGVVVVWGMLSAPERHAIPKLRATLAISMPTAAVLMVYLALNLVVFGVPTPVSGMAKSLGGPFLNLEVVRVFLGHTPIQAPVVGDFSAGVLLGLTVVPAIVLLRRNAVGSGQLLGWSRDASRWLEAVLWVLIASCCVQLGYFTFTSSWPLWRWYYYYLPLLMVVAIAVLAQWCLQRFGHSRGGTTIVSLLMSVILVVVLVRWLQYRFDLDRTGSWNYQTHSVELAEFLNTFPADAVFAMGDRAGSLSYLLERPLIQLEGLVNSAEYLDAVKSGEAHRFLQQHGIDYYIVAAGVRGTELANTVAIPGRADDSCYSIDEPHHGEGPSFQVVVCDSDLLYRAALDDPGNRGGSYSVWRYRRDLNAPGSR
jgi:hypothetical protein